MVCENSILWNKGVKYHERAMMAAVEYCIRTHTHTYIHTRTHRHTQTHLEARTLAQKREEHHTRESKRDPFQEMARGMARRRIEDSRIHSYQRSRSRYSENTARWKTASRKDLATTGAL